MDNIEDSVQGYEDFYKKLRVKIRKWLESKEGKNHRLSGVIMLAPDLVHLLIRLILDADVPKAQKAKLIAVLAYFVSPIDMIPEGIVGPAGYIDDIVLAVMTLHAMLNHVDEEVVRRHWAGEGDILEVVQSILDSAASLLDEGILRNLKRMLGLEA